MSKKQNKRPWRKLIKKLQRKRRRQNLARQRDKESEEAELGRLKDPLYISWLENQKEAERQRQLLEEREHKEQEEQWLRRELLAQKQFKKDEIKRKAEEARLEAARLKQEQELKEREEANLKKREALKLQVEKAAKEFDEILQCMQEYLEESGMKTPPRLECFVETRPGVKSCEFYDKTNCCRFGCSCSFNHRRPILAKIIVIRHFFHHPLLEYEEHEEYSKSDSGLELNERDLRESYDEFCADVWPVLEEFGNIINFRAVRNTHPHLRGHVFVEYAEKRSALKAFTNLQSRYYASKRLNVEFSNICHWRTGVCGMHSNFLKGLSLSRKCPKGFKCNFLHFMQNVNNKYNTPIHNQERSLRNVTRNSKLVCKTPELSWDIRDSAKSQTSHNWRWSESPEMEFKTSVSQEDSKTSVKKNCKDTSIIPKSSKTPSSSDSDKTTHKSKHKTSKKSPHSERSSKICSSSVKHRSRKKSRDESPKYYKRKRLKSPLKSNKRTPKKYH